MKILKTIVILLLSLVIIATSYGILTEDSNDLIIAYDDITATYYNAVPSQTNNRHDVTADGSKIIVHKASDHRWIAVSQDLLWDTYRQKLTNSLTRFNGKLAFGDSVYISGVSDRIDGVWHVHDVMNKRYRNKIDFLLTVGDRSLYGANTKSIEIYTFK